jgi:hypothetical protein
LGHRTQIKEGAIQVDSPPPVTRPVGGKPGVTTLMYLVELRFRKKVAKVKKITGKSLLSFFPPMQAPAATLLKSFIDEHKAKKANL